MWKNDLTMDWTDSLCQKITPTMLWNIARLIVIPKLTSVLQQLSRSDQKLLIIGKKNKTVECKNTDNIKLDKY